MYNKNQYKKITDKKILHKVKGQWKIISMALLGTIGGGVAATHVNANADVNAQSNDGQVNHAVSTKTIPNRTSLQMSDQANHSNLYNAKGTVHNSVKSISQQSTDIHNRIIQGITKGYQNSAKRSPHHQTRLLGASNDTDVNANTASPVSTGNKGSVSPSSAQTSMVKSGNKTPSSFSEISVSPSVRSFMINGASVIASYNQITANNKTATIDDLNSLNTSNNSSLASEKAKAENYVNDFYNNPEIKGALSMNSEAAHDIRVWGEDPRYFTYYHADPDSIENNVRSLYEPQASYTAFLTSAIRSQVQALGSSQQISHSTSSPSNSQSNSTVAPTISDNMNTITSYDNNALNYDEAAINSLNSINVSSNSSLTSLRSNYMNEVIVDRSLVNDDQNLLNSANAQLTQGVTPDAQNSLSNEMVSEIAAASSVAGDAKLILNYNVEPLTSKANFLTSSSSNNTSSVKSSDGSLVSNSTRNASTVSSSENLSMSSSSDKGNSYASSVAISSILNQTNLNSMVASNSNSQDKSAMSHINSALNTPMSASQNANQVKTNAGTSAVMSKLSQSHQVQSNSNVSSPSLSNSSSVMRNNSTDLQSRLNQALNRKANVGAASANSVPSEVSQSSINKEISSSDGTTGSVLNSTDPSNSNQLQMNDGDLNMNSNDPSNSMINKLPQTGDKSPVKVIAAALILISAELLSLGIIFDDKKKLIK